MWPPPCCAPQRSRTAKASTSACRSRTKSRRLIEESRELNGYFERQSLLYGEPRVVELVASVGRQSRAAADGRLHRVSVLRAARSVAERVRAAERRHLHAHGHARATRGHGAARRDPRRTRSITSRAITASSQFRSANKKIVASMVLTGVLRRIRRRDFDGPRRVDVRLQSRARAGGRRPRGRGCCSPADTSRTRCPEIYGVLARRLRRHQPRMPTIWSTHPQLEARAARTREQVAGAPAASATREASTRSCCRFAR